MSPLDALGRAAAGLPPTSPALPFSWRDTILSFWKSEGVPSSRLLAGFIVAMFGLGLQYWALHTPSLTKDQLEMVKHCLDADFLFSGGLFGIGAVKVIASRFAVQPPTDASTT